MEHRAKLIDIAAFLDRVDRAASNSELIDFRIIAFKKAIDILSDGESQRAKRILDSFSDPTDTPIDSAANMKGAYGVYPDSGAGS